MFFSEALKQNRATLALAIPMIAGQVGQMLMGWADTVMVGRIGVVPLAACAFANTLLAVFILFAFGLMTCVTVRTSQAFGAGRPAGAIYRAGLWLALLAGAGVAGAVLMLLPALGIFGQDPEVVQESRVYLCLVAFSIVPLLLSTASKNFSEALSRPWPVFWILIAGVLLNVWLNWIFIFGNLGSPPLGLAGAGVATLLARLAVFFAMFFYVGRARSFRGQVPDRYFSGVQPADMVSLLRIGLPAGGQLLAEVSAFAFASLMMGWISIEALAAHQIAITCAATTFMIPLGLGMAVAVRIGQAVGGKRPATIRPIAAGAMVLTLGIMSIAALFFLLFGTWIARIFIADPGVIALTATLLFVAGIFQLIDGTQVLLLNALRGMADVTIPMVIAVASYWILAVPCSWLLAFRTGAGAPGVWIGLAIGLLAAAAMLAARFMILTRSNLPDGSPR